MKKVNFIKSRSAMIILITFLSAGILNAQTFTAEKVKGNVKALISSSENWTDVKTGEVLSSNSIVVTGKNSSVQLNNNDVKFTLKESSALSLSDLKKMSLDDLLLALAMENIINVHPQKEEGKTKNTAVYGTEENGKEMPVVKSDNFGIKRLNGAMQLAENGYEASAVVAAKETYRKYPNTKNIPSYRIYFADILFDKGLYDDAYAEFNSIKKMNLSNKEKEEVDNKINQLNKKILSKE